MNTLRFLINILFIAVAINASAVSVRLTGSSGSKAVTVDAPASSGLNAVFVVPDSENINAELIENPNDIKWYKFDSRGAAYAEPVTDGLNLTAGYGYIIEDSGNKFYFWITDYSEAAMTIGSLEIQNSDCSSVDLLYTGSAPRLTYQTITGRTVEIDREINLLYYTLEQDGDKASFKQISVNHNLPYINEYISIPSPFCATRFTLKGDRFLRSWGKEIEINSDVLTPTAVTAAVTVEQTLRDASNEQNSADTSFGGSAPVHMQLRAAVTDAAVFTEWQIASDAEFINITLREQSPEWDYTFTETGNQYIRFMCANYSGSCDRYSDTYTVSIGESRLRCPNVFSPATSEGVNDEWRVSYKSITSFECHIFNRLGVKIAELNDPSQGWDGKYKGHFVKPGVYYYVIKALGADGKKYNLSGDINIIGSRSR